MYAPLKLKKSLAPRFKVEGSLAPYMA